MLHRWLARNLERDADGPTVIWMVKDLAVELSGQWGVEVSPGAVDHTIWFHEPGRSTA